MTDYQPINQLPLPSRRRFHAAAGLAIGAAVLNTTSPSSLAVPAKRPPPSDRIRVGVVGVGSRGFNLLDDLLKLADVDITVVCDVDRFHYRDNAWGKGQAYGRDAAQVYIEKKGRPKPEAVKDFRTVCENDDIDAVVIATPDHWHALCTLTAIRKGKDVYCEKPVTHFFQEGLDVCQEVHARGTVFQTGSQQRSDREFRRAVELVRNGILGKLSRIAIGLPSGYEQVQGEAQVIEPPADLDYDLWCGPAPKLDYMRARHHRWWRGHRAFGGGVLMDWIGHHNDIAHWSLNLDASGPVVVEAMNWIFPETNVYNTPWHYSIRCEYADGLTSIISDRNELGTKWIGEHGWIHVTRNKLTASNPEWLHPEFDAGKFTLPTTAGHMRNFIDCMRSRKPCESTAEIGHRSITPGHLAYVSKTVGAPLKWDPSEQKVLGNNEADQLLREASYRKPWSLQA
jgi:predicted dehydrogenase